MSVALTYKTVEEMERSFFEILVAAAEGTMMDFQNEVHDDIDNYYGSYTPVKYERTYQFKNHAVAENPSSEINGHSIAVTTQVEPSYLDYEYTTKRNGNKKYTYTEPYATGEFVVDCATKGQHGNWGEWNENKFWYDALDAMNGGEGGGNGKGIENKCIEYLEMFLSPFAV